MLGRRQALGGGTDARLGRRHRLADRKEPRDDPFDIAVDHHGPLAEGDGGDGGGGIGTDARQGQEFRLALRKRAAVTTRDGDGAGMEIAGPRIIAEPGPGLHHLGDRRRRQCVDRRPAGEEGLVIGFHRLDRRLLEHDLREPDRIRVGPSRPRSRARAVCAGGARTRRARRQVPAPRFQSFQRPFWSCGSIFACLCGKRQFLRRAGVAAGLWSRACSTLVSAAIAAENSKIPSVGAGGSPALSKMSRKMNCNGAPRRCSASGIDGGLRRAGGVVAVDCGDISTA